MEKKNLPSKEHLDFLKEVLKTNGIDLQFEISLCLSDLPKTHMTKGNNKKIYIDLVVSLRKEPDQWNRDTKVAVKPSKEDRENKAPKIYVGGGRMITFAYAAQQPPTDAELADGLPFPCEER